MKKKSVIIAAAALMLAMPTAAWSSESTPPAQEATVAEAAAETTAATEAETAAEAGTATEAETAAEAETATEAVTDTVDAIADASKDNIVTTTHTAVIQGKELSYTAQTGTMQLGIPMDTACEIFFTAYTLNGVDDPFIPADHVCLQRRSGKRKPSISTSDVSARAESMLMRKGMRKTMPAKMTDNENSLLDLTDLVIIDAVGTVIPVPWRIRTIRLSDMTTMSAHLVTSSISTSTE